MKKLRRWPAFLPRSAQPNSVRKTVIDALLVQDLDRTLGIRLSLIEKPQTYTVVFGLERFGAGCPQQRAYHMAHLRHILNNQHRFAV